MGADSCGSTDFAFYIVGNPKVFTVKDRFLIGACGSFRMMDLLRYSLNVPLQPKTMDDDAFMRTKFINAVRKTLRDGGYLLEEDKREEGGNFLVGYKGKLYEILDDSSVINVPLWGHAIGSGDMPALGSLYTTRNELDVPLRIKMALEAAEAMTPSVRSPFLQINL